MGKIEKEVPEKKEFLGLTAEATGKERLYNAKWCKEEMDVFQWWKAIGFSYHGNTEDPGKASVMAEVAMGEG